MPGRGWGSVCKAPGLLVEGLVAVSCGAQLLAAAVLQTEQRLAVHEAGGRPHALADIARCGDSGRGRAVAREVGRHAVLVIGAREDGGAVGNGARELVTRDTCVCACGGGERASAWRTSKVRAPAEK